MSVKQRVKKIPTKLHLSIPPETSKLMDVRMHERGYVHYAEFLRALIRADLSNTNLNEELVARLEAAIIALDTLVGNLIDFYDIHANAKE